jgi:hypothetical protein
LFDRMTIRSLSISVSFSAACRFFRHLDHLPRSLITGEIARLGCHREHCPGSSRMMLASAEAFSIAKNVEARGSEVTAAAGRGWRVRTATSPAAPAALNVFDRRRLGAPCPKVLHDSTSVARDCGGQSEYDRRIDYDAVSCYLTVYDTHIEHVDEVMSARTTHVVRLADLWARRLQ